MVAHVRRVQSLLSPNGLWDTGFQFGDWLDPDAPPEDPADAKADKGVVATACAYRSADLVAETAALLGRADEASRVHGDAARAAGRLQRALRRRRQDPERLHDRLRAGHRVRPARRRPTRRVAGDRLAELVAEARLPHLDRLRRHAVHH